MGSYINYLTMTNAYGYFWGKYRPAILKLMMSSAEGPQQYKFSPHEVRTAGQKHKGGFTFALKIHKGKAVNDIRSSPIAKDLLRVLQESAKARELSESSMYEFKFDKHFTLHVSKTENPLPEPSSDIVTDNIEN